MNKHIRRKAKKRVQKRHSFYIVATVFGAISILLFIISLSVVGTVATWITFPVVVFSLVLGIIYVSMFGFSLDNLNNDYWKEDEIEAEMAKIRRETKLALPPAEDLSAEDKLELKELERLKEKWDDFEDYA